MSGTARIGSQIWYKQIKEPKVTPTYNSNNPTLQYDVALTKQDIPKPYYKTLFSVHPRHISVTKFLVHLVRHDGTRLFTLFEDYLEFYKYNLSYKPEYRCFFETILGEKAQKPHFDIDIDITDENRNMNFEEVKDILIDNIILTLLKFDVKLSLNKDIILCTSHREDKRSYHIIINNYSHANNEEAKYFYEMVTCNIPIEYKKYMDEKVYSSLQQFRILGSRKFDKNNTKVFQETWNYRNQTIKYMYPVYVESSSHKEILQLAASLVTETSSCSMLPILVPEKVNKRFDDPNWTGITKEEAENALQMLADMNSISCKDSNFPFFFEDIEDHFVILKRRYASSCRVCERIHEKENPYLFIVGNQKTIWFDCRRSNNNKKLFVGKLYPEREPDYEDGHGVDEHIDNVKRIMIEMGYGDEDINRQLITIANEVEKQNLEREEKKRKEEEDETEIEIDMNDVERRISEINNGNVKDNSNNTVNNSSVVNLELTTITNTKQTKVTTEIFRKVDTPYIPYSSTSSTNTLAQPVTNSQPVFHPNTNVYIPPVVKIATTTATTNEVNIFSYTPQHISDSTVVTPILNILSSSAPIIPTMLAPSYGMKSSIKFRDTNPLGEILTEINLTKMRKDIDNRNSTSNTLIKSESTNISNGPDTVIKNEQDIFNFVPSTPQGENDLFNFNHNTTNNVDNKKMKKSIFKRKPGVFVDTTPEDQGSRFDQLNELNTLNAMTISKKVNKKKVKSTNQQLGELYSNCLDRRDKSDIFVFAK